MKVSSPSSEPLGPVGRLVASCCGGIHLAFLLLFLAPSTLGQCDAPGPFPSAKLINQTDESEFAIGTTLKYECRPGYSKKQFFITCQQNSVWTDAEDMCKRKSCKHPGDLDNGMVHVHTNLQFGSRIDYTCNQGYRLIGQSSAECTVFDDTVAWDSGIPTCELIPCEQPPTIPNGLPITSGDDFRYGVVVTYRCSSAAGKKTHLVGEPSIHCTSSDGKVGVWSGPPPQCIELDKCIPPHVENAVMVPENRSLFSVRDTVEFECQPGFSRKGAKKVECHSLNKWEPALPTCFKVKPCGAFLDQLPNGRVLFPLNLQLGAKVSFVCNKGFQLKGNSASHCTLTGTESTWNSSVPVCEPVTCTIPQNVSGIQRNLVMKNPYSYGANVTMECDHGYTLEGSSHSQCQSDGSWFPPLAKCVSRSNGALIAGIIFGIIFFVLFIFVSCWMIMKYKKRSGL